MFKYIRLAALLLVDAVLVALSVYMSYLLRFDFTISKGFANTLPYVIPTIIIFTLLSLYSFKIYRRIWQYASLRDLFAILKGVSVGIIIFYLFHHGIINRYSPTTVVPRSIYPLTIIVVFLMISGSRVAWKILRENNRKILPHQLKTLIVGAGEVGVMVVKELRRVGSLNYPIAFIDDNKQKKNYEVLGIPVVGTREDIPCAVNKYNIDEIILAIPNAPRSEISEIIKICKESNCKTKILPAINDLIDERITINTIRNVSVDDLLGRDPIQLDIESVANYVSNKSVLITGAGGSIGSELCRQIIKHNPKKLLLLGHGENSIYNINLELKKIDNRTSIIPIIIDIKDYYQLKKVFENHKPHVVFHAAAHKHVPLMEENPIEAIKNNIFGTYNVAMCSNLAGSERFVMISTDKAVNPTNIMGATKKTAELIVQGISQVSNTIFTAVRFGNVLGSRGSVIPIFKQQIEEGGPLTVTHPEMVRYFMTIPEAVQLVIQAGAIAVGGEIFILDMGKPVKIVDLAKDLIRLSGLEPERDIKITYSGIRPGEKLFEEILSSEEGAFGTKFDRIYIGKSSPFSFENMKEMISEFEDIISREEQSDNQKIKDVLYKWIPSYSSGNTKLSDPIDKEKAFIASREIVAALDRK